MFFSPGLRDPAALVEEFAHDVDVVAKHVPCHPHPVDLDVRSEIFLPFDSVLVDRSIVGDDEGHHHRLGNFLFSCVSGGPLSELSVFLFERFVHVFC